MSRPRVVLADAHLLHAEGMRCLLESRCEVVAIVGDRASLIEALLEHEPDLAITEMAVSEGDGTGLLDEIGQKVPDTRTILLTVIRDIGLAAEALRHGAAGYVLLDNGAQDILQAVDEVLEGGVHVSPQIAGEVLRAVTSGKLPKPHLTSRQMEILALLVAGLSAREIAKRIHISPRTVEYHKYKAMERLGLSSNAELIAYGVRQGIGS